MTTTTPGATSAPEERATERQHAAFVVADTLRSLAQVIESVGVKPLGIYLGNLDSKDVEVHVYDLRPWLCATGIDEPIAYTPDGVAMWRHEDGTWRPTSRICTRGFSLRHVDLSQTQPGV